MIRKSLKNHEKWLKNPNFPIKKLKIIKNGSKIPKILKNGSKIQKSH